MPLIHITFDMHLYNGKIPRRSLAFFANGSMNIDATMLARGMSSRYVGTIVSIVCNFYLSNEEIQRDLNFMVGYANVCTAYTQHYFVHRNSELIVNNTHYANASSAGRNMTSSDQKKRCW